MTFMGRETELNYLNQHYESHGSRILVVYGQKGVGKTTLLQKFSKGKPCAYYIARSCSDREQRFQWGQEFLPANRDDKDGLFPEYEEIFASMTYSVAEEGKCVLIVDEFHHLIKGEATFFNRLIQYVQACQRPHFVILCSSAAGWVENNMVSKIGSAATAISGFMKIRDLNVRQMQEIFNDYSEDDCIQLYSILGGVPGLWKRTDSRLSAKNNIIWNILNPYSAIYGEMSGCLLEDLRETAVYNTILSSMANGSIKLNDMYRHTGFSRAKISVYLKNLMEIDLVEKIGAGMYRISKPYVRFYFRFIYSNQSRLEKLTPEQFYLEVVEDAFPGFVREAYRKS
ncbi:MAG: AAA family ATPase [Lachnospiraceae bacterium]|nr:AAA family ATPase [Lachnospiraceae bacterium]